MKHNIYIVGMGPGAEEQMSRTGDRRAGRKQCVVGYPVYLKLLGERFKEKELLSTPMKQEIERCKLCFENAMQENRWHLYAAEMRVYMGWRR